MALTRVLDKECNLDAPLSEWEQSNEYESLSACQADQAKASATKRKEIDEIDKSIKAAEPEGPSPPPMNQKQSAIEESYRQSQEREIECAGYARCVSSDDPRLAK